MVVKPGEGIRSIGTSPFFRITNFELYVKPNVFIMAFGLSAFMGAVGYIAYMKHKYENIPVDQDGQEYFEKRKSKWD